MITLLLLFLSIVFIILTTTKLKWHPFLALLAASFLFGVCTGMPLEQIIETINEGFGGTIGKIGIIIIAGLIIGTFLEKSGGAYTLANFVLKIVGTKRIHATMATIGYIVSIPVFCDSGYIILSPLNKALTKKAGLSLAGTALALGLGLTATHTMVPPTPGPIAAAGILDADLGRVIIIGLVTSILTLIVCIAYAKRMGNRVWIDAVPDQSDEAIEAIVSNAPSALKSFLPIIIPIILIVIRSIIQYPTQPFGDNSVTIFLSFIGNPIVALVIGMSLSFLLPQKWDKEMLSTTGWVGDALKSAAIIILITGAGGAFGKVLQSSAIADILASRLSQINIGIWLPFAVAAAIKTAQGSSTGAIITTASIVAPLLPSLGLDTEMTKAMAVVAIGAGSAVVSHANDSFFWVFTQMSNMEVNHGYRLHTQGTALLGFTAIIILTMISYIL